MSFLSQPHEPGAGNARTPSPSDDIARVPAALPTIELSLNTPFRPAQSFAALLSNTIRSDHAAATAQPTPPAPAAVPLVDAAFPTHAPEPPPARFAAMRRSTADD